mmetsp:Transcript_37409/g.78902  ORF Transcript_37409/g.78902 Transcript_37409/m.78902 type:complete len:264 (-) Transcript_37409:168-959(-)|eukprot:CAMPEP_0183724370 /NCGR_PEP_ID=MMETSP0737-20130205/17885_1 /TAXON_ID=385413 /ORGANISM="Thalassiosira miniscula, Strain CCMP1093" /LENGTH=263 /DNA_ID=CAMNT_0025954937 /DNA_START=163 /DNA_END=954 /DNA_ORIENTATION=+
MVSSSYFNDCNDFLDAELLRLSDHGGDAVLDSFDFILEEDGGDGELLFASTSTKVASSLLGMDFQFETLENSLNNIHMDSDDTDETKEEDQARPPVRRRGKRDASPSKKRVEMNDINFDPPKVKAENIEVKQQNRRQYERSGSCSDISMSSCESSSDQPTATDEKGPESSKVIYNEALQKLADSMKRSEETRRQVMMQRNMLPPDQQRALSLASVQLKHQNQQAQSSIMASFFTGSRRTLTNSLEQSRRQISMYMGQVNHRTL